MSVSGGGEIVRVKLLTHPRHKRDLSRDDYHIVQFAIPSKNKTVTIHLTKAVTTVSPDFQTFVHTEQNGRKLVAETEDSHHTDCFYSGVIVGDAEGSAALSTCDRRRPGFTGMLIIDKKHLILQPAAPSSLRDKSEAEMNAPFEIRHMLSKTQETILSPRNNRSDVLRVPKEDLLEAVELMAKELGGRNENNESVNKEENDVQEDPPLKPMDLAPETANGISNSVNAETLASNQKTRKEKMKKPSSNKLGKRSDTKGKKYILDLAIFCDSKMYRTYKKRFSKDTLNQIKVFVLTIVNCMNMIYQQKSLEIVVQIRLAHLEIMQNDPSDLGVSEHAIKYLKSFCKYAGAKNSNGQHWDHALIMTGYDIEDNGEKAVAGLAWANTMCLRYWSCSISEAGSFESVYTLAHEIGHSLGMEHDGIGSAKSCDAEKYIMSPTTGAGKVIWSSCSSASMIEFIKSGTTAAGTKESSNIPSCLSTASKKSKSINYSSKKLPGAVYPAKTQCELKYGSGNLPYTSDTKYKNICSMLYCWRKQTATSIAVQSAHPALEGTACAPGNVCRNGKCQ